MAAIRRPNEPRNAAPAAASIHPVPAPVPAPVQPGRIRYRLHQIRRLPVRRPLPHVPQHVVQAPLVRLLQTHRMRRATAVGVIPRYRVQFPVPRPGRPRPRRVLPLRFCRQPIPVPARLLQIVQSQDELMHVFPGHSLDRAAATALQEIRWVLPHHSPPLPLRHLVLPHPESLADPHLVPRRLVGMPADPVPRRAHLEASSRNPHELHPQRISPWLRRSDRPRLALRRQRRRQHRPS